jgi:FMN phosphatase YigB (HAD superfamily)
MRIVVFDLDGVIFDPTHRLHLLKEHYTVFEKAVIRDPPIQKTIDLINSFNRRSTSIVLLTSRSEGCRADTEYKLEKHQVTYDKLIMRKVGDDSPSDVCKVNLLRSNFSKDVLSCIVGIYDDDEMNIAAFRRMGLPAFLVVN